MEQKVKNLNSPNKKLTLKINQIVSKIIKIIIFNVLYLSILSTKPTIAENLTTPSTPPVSNFKYYYTIYKDKKFSNFTDEKDAANFLNITNTEQSNQKDKLHENENPVSKTKYQTTDVILKISTDQEIHKIEGFGASITDSCLSNLKSLAPSQRNDFFNSLFKKSGGANLNILRLPLGGNDFSSTHYTYNDLPSGEKDTEFKKLDFTKLDAQIDFIKQAQKVNSNLTYIGSPWSPPAWMKDNNKLQGGQLLPIHYDDYAKYISKTLSYLNKKKINLKYLTILNEPLIFHAKSEWGFAQTYMDEKEQFTFITQNLIPQFAKNKIKTKILIHDHNWENADTIIDRFKPLFENKHPFIGGVATHCYGGNYEVQLNLLKKYNAIPILNTECSGTLNHPNDSEYFQWWMQTQTLDSIQAGSRGSLGWNLCLDNKGGPRNNGCEGCRGLLTISPEEKNPKEKNIVFNPEYYAIKQVSPFIDSNSKVVKNELLPSESLTESDLKSQSQLQVHALTFLNSNKKLTVVLRNPTNQLFKVSMQTDKSKPSNLNLNLNQILLPPQSAVTLTQK